MCLIVFCAEVFEAHVCVFLGCGEAGVTEQFLDGPKVSAAFQQVSGEGMAERMGREAAAGRKPCACCLDQALDIAGVQAAPTKAHKDGDVAAIFGLRKADTIPF